LRVVALVEPDPVRRRAAAELYGIGPDRQYDDVSDLPDQPLARAAINGTMDALHVPTSLVLLEKGYDLLLEKPIALDASGVVALQQRADELGRTVVVCHVLRHAPFYAAIKQRIAAGEIGEVMTLELTESVAYDHMATCFVRGRWRRTDECGSSILMAKSCHDMDLMSWFAEPAIPVRATSAGSRRWFRPERAPEGAGTRCVVDCAIERDCAYSARRIYLENDKHGFYSWESLEHLDRTPTEEEKLASLAGDNPMGRCVWHSDNDVADHQSVVVEFDSGTTATLTVTTTAARGDRTLHIVGTRGEIAGSLVDSTFTVRTIDVASSGYVTETVSVTAPPDADGYAGQGHGGGDLRLVADFLAVLRGREPSLSTTALADSVNGHLAGFAAEQGRLERRWVDLAELRDLVAPIRVE
jgi:predicted dehydrogenase